jgi:hypothetical protein
MIDRLEEEHFEALRQWGQGLLRDPREEMHAAGRAIVLLCAEIERLERDLWNEKTLRPVVDSTPADDELAAPMEKTLRERLRGTAQSLYMRPTLSVPTMRTRFRKH